jgi:hypothetical protein
MTNPIIIITKENEDEFENILNNVIHPYGNSYGRYETVKAHVIPFIRDDFLGKLPEFIQKINDGILEYHKSYFKESDSVMETIEMFNCSYSENYSELSMELMGYFLLFDPSAGTSNDFDLVFRSLTYKAISTLIVNIVSNEENEENFKELIQLINKYDFMELRT